MRSWDDLEVQQVMRCATCLPNHVNSTQIWVEACTCMCNACASALTLIHVCTCIDIISRPPVHMYYHKCTWHDSKVMLHVSWFVCTSRSFQNLCKICVSTPVHVHYHGSHVTHIAGVSWLWRHLKTVCTCHDSAHVWYMYKVHMLDMSNVHVCGICLTYTCVV